MDKKDEYNLAIKSVNYLRDNERILNLVGLISAANHVGFLDSSDQDVTYQQLNKIIRMYAEPLPRHRDSIIKIAAFLMVSVNCEIMVNANEDREVFIKNSVIKLNKLLNK